MITFRDNKQYFDYINNNYVLGSFKLVNSRIVFGNCTNNIVILNNVTLKNSLIYMRNNNSVCIIDSSNINNLNPVIISENVVLCIGKGFTCGKTEIRVGDANIFIGNDVMFSQDIYIQNHDGHCIYSVESGELLTHGKSIFIGNHVWVGYHCTILKGSVIGSGSIVGAGTLVNKVFSNNSLIAGYPSKVIKNEVFWIRQGLHVLNKSDKRKFSNFKGGGDYIFNNDEFLKKISNIDNAINLLSVRDKAKLLCNIYNISDNIMDSIK